MATESGSPLPWEALKHTEGGIPWAALETFADALGTEGSVFQGLADLYDEFMADPYQRPTYEDLYVPAILALAAPRLTGAWREKAAEFLVTALVEAEEEDDEVLIEMLEAACGALGPSILPAVLKAMPVTFRPWEVTLGLWGLMTLAAKTDDPALKDRTIEICLKALHKAERGRADITDVEPAAWTLAALGYQEARPLIQRLYDQTECPDLRTALEMMDGTWQPEEPLQAWEEPLRTVLQRNWEALRRWYADRDKTLDTDALDGDLPDEDDEAGYRRAVELAGRFADSQAFADLPEHLQEHAPFIAQCILEYASTYEGAAPEELDERTLREVLLELFPRKVTAGRKLFENVAPVAQAFLKWLNSEGILGNGLALAATVIHWGDQIVANSMDRHRWGMGKGLVMLAQSEGVDLEDRDAMQRFVMDYNRRPLGRGDPEPAEDDAWPVGSPIVNPSPKVGRNDPCPCGSGKKYKKCCGQRTS